MIGLGSKVAKVAKVAKKVADTKKSAVRKVFDELPESEKAELPSQPDDGSLIGYHGTAKERSADEPFFDIDFARKQDQFMGEGFYFTIDPNIASEYANMRAFKDFDIEGSDGKGGSLLRKRDSGVLTSTSKLLEGLDIDDNPIAMNQSISRFDLSGLEKPYVVKNNKDRLYLKDNIEKIKKQGYDSVLFAEFGDRSKQIMVFPKHMDKIDTSKMASIKRASSNFAEPLEIGTSEFNVKNPDKVLKSHTLEDLNAIDIKRSKAGSSLQTAKINVPVEEGAEKSVRLNLNSKIDPDRPLAPFNHLQTIHPVNSKGTPIYSTAESYMPAVTVEKGTFHVNQSKRRKISEEGLKEAAMSVQGKFTSKRNVLDEMDDTVVEVGINPKDKHLFIDMRTGQAVKAFDIATIYRDRVYVKGVEYWKKAEAPNPISAKGDIPITNQVRYKFSEGGLLPKQTGELKNTIEFNKGGTPMMEKQMEMFEDGGLKDQGGTVDPMSGNDVPVGSSQKEVRDDIPAQLSEGEFVFPADVVRFIGLEKLMGLRQQAKMGLKEMEDMGQMGNSEEATVPDDMPFGMSDLIVMSPEGQQVEMAEGGVVRAATGVNVTPSTRSSSTGATRTNNITPTSSNFATSTTRPLVTGTSNTGPRPNVPTFEASMGQAAITLIQYKNSEGATLMVPTYGWKTCVSCSCRLLRSKCRWNSCKS